MDGLGGEVQNLQGEENVEFAREVLGQMVVERVIYGWGFDGVGQRLRWRIVDWMVS